MNIAALYELRERLKAGAVAGTELLQEDFRLKKALEAFSELEQISPVFGKIGQLSRAVIAPDCKERGKMLMEALTLVDAVLCTQGAVAVDDVMEPIRTAGSGLVINEIPYSTLSVLLDALKNSGGGRYSIVVDAYAHQPELFEDYRVKAALVQALGASYADLANLAADWLKREDSAVIPLLKQGFDPKGSKEMMRRVQVIDAIAGAAENDFYLQQLEQAERDVKAALIFALRHTEENAERLLQLVKTEKGNAKIVAHHALAYMKTETVWQYWSIQGEKHPEKTAQYMKGVSSAASSRLVAQILQKQLELLTGTDKQQLSKRETAETLYQIFQALPGKTGTEICQCYRKAAVMEPTLRAIVQDDLGNKVPTHYSLSHEQLDVLLRKSLLIAPVEELKQLAMELYETYGLVYLPAAITAKLLQKDMDACYTWLAALLKQKSNWNGIGVGSYKPKELPEFMQKGLSALCWSEKRQVFELQMMDYDLVTQQNVWYYQPITEQLDPRFYDLLMESGQAKLDQVLARWIQPQNQSLCEKLGRHFYRRALLKNDSKQYLAYMEQCGWKDCTNLALNYCKRNPDLSNWNLRWFLEDMPGSAAAKAEELKRVWTAWKQGEIKLSPNAATWIAQQFDDAE